MNVGIAVNPDLARKAYLEYREVFKSSRRQEDALMARAYRQASLGHRIVNVREAIRDGGLGEDGMPRLAIARADQTSVLGSIDSRGSVHIWPAGRVPWERFAKDVHFVAERLFPDDDARRGTRQMASMVPIIPPALRPSVGLTGYHVLWEATWHVPTRIEAPGDPALLMMLSGDLAAVLAVWDLTDLERMVLGLTRGAP